MVAKVNPTPSFPYLTDPQNIPPWANLLIQALQRELGYDAARLNGLLAGDGSERAVAPVLLAAYTVAVLHANTSPAATAYPGGIVYVSDGAANKKLAISDGLVWRYAEGTAV